jgi:hypothetical protein
VLNSTRSNTAPTAGGSGGPPSKSLHHNTSSLCPSSLRPPCKAKDRLFQWTPVITCSTSASSALIVPRKDIDRIYEVLDRAWAPGTRETYGTGLLAFHIFCDNRNVPELHRAPANPTLISAFISTLAGSYSASAISNYLSGVRTWHTIHGVKWTLHEKETEALLKAASTLAPPHSKKAPREPYTVQIILVIRDNLDLACPIHAAVFACLTTAFYATARTGELTIPNLKAFDPALHIKPIDVHSVHDRQGNEMTNFHLPRSKSAPQGEDISWARQTGPSDPQAAFSNHLAINAPPRNGPLFAYRHGKGHKPLTKNKFLDSLSSALKAAGHAPMNGHGIRIGSTLEYLLRNVPFDVVKVKGRWASDAFLAYLRRHAQILAPYMQATPAVHESLLRLTLPPIR